MIFFQVFILAVFNILIIYYVFTKFDFTDDKQFVPKFLTRLPKYSLQKETETQRDVKSPSEHPASLVDSMKNFLFSQIREESGHVEEDVGDSVTSKTVTNKELESRLLDSSEIELYTEAAHPFLGLQTPKLESLKQFQELMRTRVKRLERGCSSRPQLGAQSSINYGYLYVLKVRRHTSIPSLCRCKTIKNLPASVCVRLSNASI